MQPSLARLITLAIGIVTIALSPMGSLAEAQPLVGQPGRVTNPVSENRVALVIGNSAYVNGPLKNPANDAADVAAKLRQIGFDVVERGNLRTAQIGRTLREFRSKLSPGAVALVFYAGHGLQIRGENFLPTVDAEIEGEEDVLNQSLGLRQLMEILDESKTRLNLVFLDACRNNPFMPRSRSSNEGLARVMAPSGTLISYATRPGSVASDGDGRNGLYTTHLLQILDVPNQPIEQSLKRIVSGVKSASRGQQEPWMEGSIEGDFYFLRRAEAVSEPPEIQQRQQETIDRAVAEAVRRANEQATRERAELQASMERVIRQALAEQTTRLNAERQATTPAAPAAIEPLPRLAGARPAAAPTATAATSVPTPTAVTTTNAQPARLAMHAPSSMVPGSSEASATIGEEAVYRSTSFGKQQFLVIYTPDGSASRHDLRWGKATQEFDASQAFVTGAANEGGILFSPRWIGEFREATSELGSGGGLCAENGMCRVNIKPVGDEKLSLPAGSFDAVRFDGWLTVRLRNVSNAGFASGPVSVWYSRNDRRLLKQVVALKGERLLHALSESLELERLGRGKPLVVGLPASFAGELNRQANSMVRFSDVKAGDEWEYNATDNEFGKTHKLLWRVVAVADGRGVLEEYLMNGKRGGQWVADGSPTVIGIGSDMGLFFMPHWQTANLDRIGVANWGMTQFGQVSLRGELIGQERLKVPAGTFDTSHIKIQISISNIGQNRTVSGHIDVWYATDLRRVIRQSGQVSGQMGIVDSFRFNDNFELAAVRRAIR